MLLLLFFFNRKVQGPVVQSVVSLTSSLRVILLTVLADSMHNILIFYCGKMTAEATHIFSAKKIHHICVSLGVNFNEPLTNDVVSFVQLGPDNFRISPWIYIVWGRVRSASKMSIHNTCFREK